MNHSAKKVRLTTLRDLEAFQVDALDTHQVVAVDTFDTHKVVAVNTSDTHQVVAVDTFDTYKVVAVDTFDTQKIESTNIKVFPSREATDSLLSSKAKLDGPTAIIPFPTSTAPLKERQRQKVDYQQRATTIVAKAKKKKWVKLAARAGCTLLLFVFLFKSLSWSTLFTTLSQVDLAIILIGLTIGTCGTFVSAYQWRSLLLSERIYSDLARLVNLYVVGIAFSHFLPTSMGGDVVKALYVGRESGNSIGSASAIVMSRVTGFFAMLFVGFTALLIWHAAFTPDIVIGFVLLSTLVGSLICGTVFATKLLPKLLKGKWATHRIFTSATRIGNAISASAQRPRSLSIATLFGILFHVVASLNYYSYALALHMSVPLYFYFVAIPFVSLIAFLPISINGFGVRESAFVYIFSTVHVPATTSLLLVFLIDVQVLFFGAVGGLIYLTMSHIEEQITRKQRIA